MTRPILNAIVFLFALASLPLLGQDTPATAGAPGCGDPSAQFEVKTDNVQGPAQPEPNKALVYFIEDDTNFGSFPKPTTRAGMDGKWVGATHGNSYFIFSVDPGVHHLCARWQRKVIVGKGLQMAAAHFTAEPGGVYYYRVKNVFLRGEYSALSDISMTPLDNDEGQALANQFHLAVSTQKK